MVGIRNLIEEVELIGFGASLQSKSSKVSIKEVMRQTVFKYTKRFLICLCLWVPIMVMMYILPYVAPNAMIDAVLFNGISTYIFVFAVFATVI